MNLGDALGALIQEPMHSSPQILWSKDVSIPYISVETGVRAQYHRTSPASWALESMFAASIPHLC